MSRKNMIIMLLICSVLLISLIGITVVLETNAKREAMAQEEANKATLEDVQVNENMENTEPIDEGAEIMYTRSVINVYKAPNVDSGVICKVDTNTRVYAINYKEGNWCKIKIGDTYGYVQPEVLTMNVEIPEGEPLTPEDEIENIPQDVEEETVPEETTEPQYSEDGVYLIVNEEVRAEGNVWLRSAPKMSGKEVVILSHGKTITRVGIGSNGWSQVLYNDEILYVTTYWVAPTKSPKYQEVQEFVKLTESANLRESGSINSRKIAALPKGVEMVRIGISQHGWSKVIYNGHVRYIYTLYVTPIDREVAEADLEIKSE